MKLKHHNIYESLFDFKAIQNKTDLMFLALSDPENLARVYDEVAAGSGGGSIACIKYGQRKFSNSLKLSNLLRYNQYQVQACSHFVVTDTKRREINAPAFVDRIVQHALYDFIQPIFEHSFIFHSYACRDRKGMHRTARTFQQHLRHVCKSHEKPYIVQADISKYFLSVNIQRLFNIIYTKLYDSPNTCELCRKILLRYVTTAGTGIPVGALTSQLFANLYLNEIDHLFTDEYPSLFYIRYMDDIAIFCKDKNDAKYKLRLLEEHLHRILLKLNPKTKILPARIGTDFCGYRIRTDCLLPRKRNVKKFRHFLKSIFRDKNHLPVSEDVLHIVKQKLASFVGYMKPCNKQDIMQHLYLEYPELEKLIPLTQILAELTQGVEEPDEYLEDEPDMCW
jgi:hypothetical protein